MLFYISLRVFEFERLSDEPTIKPGSEVSNLTAIAKCLPKVLMGLFHFLFPVEGLSDTSYTLYETFWGLASTGRLPLQVIRWGDAWPEGALLCLFELFGKLYLLQCLH